MATNDTMMLAKSLNLILGDAEVSAFMRENALTNADRFSKDVMIEKTLRTLLSEYARSTH